jgi:hypothetical protein
MQKARRHPTLRRTPTACKRTVSGSISPRYSRYFSPFPHGTGSLSVSQEYLALPDGAGKFNRDFSCPGLLRIPASNDWSLLRGCHPLWPPFPRRSNLRSLRLCRSYYPVHAVTCMVWAVPRSLATTYGITVVFSSYGYLDVSVPHVRLSYDIPDKSGGLPHSEIYGSIRLCRSP